MNKMKIIMFGLLFLGIIGLCLAPASATKTSYYTVKIDNQKYFGSAVWSNTPSKKVILYTNNKQGINTYTYKITYKKSKNVQYKTEFASHGNIYDKNIITKAKIKYKKYNPKTGKYLNKYSYKTLKGKTYIKGGGNCITYTANKNWVPIQTTLYIKNVKT
jgi:hypothetical protein